MPKVMLSPMRTSLGPLIFRPFTRMPPLEPVSDTNQPSSRRMNTPWSRDTAVSGRQISQLLLRPTEFSQYSTGNRAPLCSSSSMTTGSRRRWPDLKEV